MSAVNGIRDFIKSHMDYLGRLGFREVGSQVTDHNGGDSLVVMESDNLRLRFVQDRSQLFLDFQPVTTTSQREWFSVDLIRRLYLGRRETSAVLDAGYAAFLRENLADLDARFAPASWPVTSKELKKLKRVRSREMFG